MKIKINILFVCTSYCLLLMLEICLKKLLFIINVRNLFVKPLNVKL
jgi:hypothetical protein